MVNSREIVNRLFDEVVNAGRVNVIAELYAPDFVDHAPGAGQLPGPTGIVQVVERYRAAIPDLHVVVDDIVIEGDRVATRETWTGTQSGDLPGAPATHRHFRRNRMHIFRLDRGRIVEEWSVG